jgi:hypothetical protein
LKILAKEMLIDDLHNPFLAVSPDTNPVTWFVDQQVAEGRWRVETIPAEVVGLSRPMTVFRAPRKQNLITFRWHGDTDTFCPPLWSDLAIGSGACGLGCRSCFLMLTHRIQRDPWRHLLYDNLDSFSSAVISWLCHPQRKHTHTLGIGIDRSDSLLYEGVAPHVRNLAPLFANPRYNPQGCKMVLLTKTANSRYLEEVAPGQRGKIAVTFSLNPQAIADLWEGVYPDTGERIPPPIAARLEAARHAQELGYEVRIRFDPILTPQGWQEQYRDFIAQVKAAGLDFRYWTLGTYREKNAQLDTWREKWGLHPPGWQISNKGLAQEGTHFRIKAVHRSIIYRTAICLIRVQFPQAVIGLCKETHQVRKRTGLTNACCNCLH